MTDVLFPHISDADPTAEGVLSTWFVKDGADVAVDELLAEVAVDKVDMEIVAPAPGRITLLAGEGDVIQQGAAVARIA
ncbi:biotin/lipoyl-containing protein [Amycolatopsis jejuensis]|uniref:biotin/lipoyl-containing protein n=1 Tax=Amycolatopsis jejuensis TaxID=330084 RepID=UPI00052567A8|nr:lipoyl domain-containing protein [Amycolatopsis jejuensis]